MARAAGFAWRGHGSRRPGGDEPSRARRVRERVGEINLGRVVGSSRDGATVGECNEIAFERQHYVKTFRMLVSSAPLTYMRSLPHSDRVIDGHAGWGGDVLN